MPPRRKNRLVVSIGLVFAALLLLSGIAIMVKSVIGIELPPKIRESLNSANTALEVATWTDLKDLKNKLNKIIDLDQEIADLEKSIRTGPGPEPHWFWDWIDHMRWKKEKEIHDHTSKAATRMLGKLREEKNQVAEDLGPLASDPHGVIRMIDSQIDPLREFWNGVLVPILHFLLSITIIRYGFSFLLRLLVLGGLVHPTRV